MSEPRRLLSELSDEDAFERDLLLSGKRDAMPVASKRALLASLGAGAAACAAAPSAVKGTSALAKWLAFGTLGAAAAVGTAVVVLRLTAAAPPAPKAAPAATLQAAAPPGPTDAPSATPPAESPPPRAAIPAASASAPATVTPRKAPRATAPPVAPSALEAESVVLDQAREALGAGSPDRALGLLETHRQRFPRPALADEAFLLRVEALAARGDAAGVRALAEPWLASHKDSPYAARVQRALRRTSAEPPAPGASPR